MSDTFCTAWDQLRAHLHTTQLFGGIHSTLYFDQNTAMPAAAAVTGMVGPASMSSSSSI